MKTKNYFSKKELCCPHCGVNKFSKDTLERFNSLREACGFPLQMNSGYRCPEYNELKGYTQTHATGQAGDIACTHKQAFKIMELAPMYGFTGIGIKQKGDARFIHLDDLPEKFGRPRPYIWSY